MSLRKKNWQRMRIAALSALAKRNQKIKIRIVVSQECVIGARVVEEIWDRY